MDDSTWRLLSTDALTDLKQAEAGCPEVETGGTETAKTLAMCAHMSTELLESHRSQP